MLGNNRQQELEQAQAFVETQRYSGLTRHYRIESVQENIEYFTDVQVTEQEAKDIVNTVRKQNGWGLAQHLEEADD
jgi:division protein CdvB (Snf7/Vps24/ESCRT-III family)